MASRQGIPSPYEGKSRQQPSGCGLGRFISCSFLIVNGMLLTAFAGIVSVLNINGLIHAPDLRGFVDYATVGVGIAMCLLFVLVGIVSVYLGVTILFSSLSYKYQELDDNDEPLVIHGQGDYQKVTRPSDISTDPEVIERNMALYDDDDPLEGLR